MAGLVPAIHVFLCEATKTWMPGTRPGMTEGSTLPSPISRHLLQHGANRRGVLGAEPLLHRFAVDRLGGGEDRRLDADLPREVADHIHVLLPDVDLHGDVVIAALHHHWRAQFEHA